LHTSGSSYGFASYCKLYPEAQLGGPYAELGQWPAAIANYKRSVLLNPRNTWGIEQLQKLRQQDLGH
jgi:hypothetical protein